MNIKFIRPGMQCTLSDGSLIEVQSLMQDEIHVRVKYLDSLDNPEIPVGDVREIPFEEIIGEVSGTHTEGLT
jgi:hypothetical protein